MSKIHTSIVRALEKAGLSQTEYMHLESDPVLAQGIAVYVKEYLGRQSSTPTAPEASEPANLRGYYDVGPLDHQFDAHTLLPWTTVLDYDVATLFGDIRPSDSQFATARSIVAILRREGVESVRDLLLLNEGLLQDFRQLGPGRLKTIVSQLTKHGMRLTDQRDLKDEQWLDPFVVRHSNPSATDTDSQAGLPYESVYSLPAVRILPGIQPSAGRAGVTVGDLVELLPDKVVVLRLNTSIGLQYIREPDRLRQDFEHAGFRVEVK